MKARGAMTIDSELPDSALCYSSRWIACSNQDFNTISRCKYGSKDESGGSTGIRGRTCPFGDMTGIINACFLSELYIKFSVADEQLLR